MYADTTCLAPLQFEVNKALAHLTELGGAQLEEDDRGVQVTTDQKHAIMRIILQHQAVIVQALETQQQATYVTSATAGTAARLPTPLGQACTLTPTVKQHLNHGFR